MPFQFLVVRREGLVEHLTLNRPEVRNAFNAAMVAELTEWAGELDKRAADTRAVVLSGEGKIFCAGADAAWMAETVRYTREQNLDDATRLARMLAALDQLRVPLIGRIQGAALGGGAGLAAVCDIVVAEEGAWFGFTEVKLGLVPAVISPFVLAKIGRSAARELFTTGLRFSASRAREIGLVHTVAAAGELDRAVVAYVDEILGAGPEAVAAAKALIGRVSMRSAADAMSITADAIATRRVSTEGQEGLRAFLERRTPSWSLRRSTTKHSLRPSTTQDTKDTKKRNRA
jgi:methylglutaconyl-CoA hydratase